MSESLNREQRMERGQRVARLLADEDITRALGELDADCVQEWRDATTPEEREKAWASLDALRKLQDRLQSTVADGQYAQAELAALTKRNR